MTHKKHKKSGIHSYTTYRFIDKDPMIDKLRTALQREFPKNGKPHTIDYEAVSRRSNVTAGTYRNWFEGDTKRPHGASFIATARAMDGWDIDLLNPEEKEAVQALRKGRRGHLRRVA